ncbi:hypothetical protein BLNAU_7087 [Blattamonas nauphoetae]|uniref:Uncharacterized protein n=1 Tax=Blattamonas nauphoetae TaxID=2049346 RepID=A0ABQ9Y2E1_9EUKA|nr:hypothetical protein BLNAU_7087 [Blattamonas nauphoetae]
MFPELQQNISTIGDRDEINHLTIGSVLERISDSSVHPRNKINSFEWTQIPTLLATHIQSEQQQQQDYEVLSQLLQRITTILDECVDTRTPIQNKRPLHSSLSQLAQSPSLSPSTLRDVDKCLASLRHVDEGDIILVRKEQFESMEATQSSLSNLQQEHDQLRVKLSESERKITKLEKENLELLEKEKTHLSMNLSLQKEKEQIQQENDQLRSELANKTLKLEEKEKILIQTQQTFQQMKAEVARKEQFFVSSEIIVSFSPNHFRVSGSTVTRINSTAWAGCFTKAVSKGIHRLSIKTNAYVLIGVIDAAKFPHFKTKGTYTSSRAAMINNLSGFLLSANRKVALNEIPRKGQELSAEADLGKRTLHYFIDGVQQTHHFVNIPVPLVFALDVYNKDAQIEITFWGEEKQSHVTVQGTGHNLG